MSIKAVLPGAGMFSLLFALHLVFASDASASCGSMPDDRPVGVIIGEKVREASAVFSGTVTGTAYRKGIWNEYAEERVAKLGLGGYETQVLIVKVDRWWKGDLAPEVELITTTVRYPDGSGSRSSEAYHLEVGKSYFISAYQTPYGLTTNRCNGLTGPAESLDRIIKYIGEGTRPVKYPLPAIIKN